MGYWLELLVSAGVSDILVNTHYLADRVAAYVKRSPFSSHVTLVHEDRLLGTAGTLLRNRDFFGSGPALLIHGDNLSLFDVSAFLDRYKRRPESVEITMMTFTTSTPESCGIVELDDAGLVRRFHEKVKNPPGNLANAAVYIVSPSALDLLAHSGKEVMDFSTEVLPHYLGRINTFHNDIYHRDIGTPESLETACLEYPQIHKRHATLGLR